MVRGEAAKFHALFHTTPAIPRGSQSPHLRETPARAVHPAGPSKTECRVVASSWRLSVNGLDTLRPLRQEHSHSLTHLLSLAQVATRQHPLHRRASGSQARPFRRHLLETPDDSQRSFSQCFSVSYAPHPPRRSHPESKAPLEVSFLVLSVYLPLGSQPGAEFQRLGLVGRPWGRPPGINGALLRTENEGGHFPH